MHSLVTFLGKSRSDPKTGYQRTRYRFSDGSISDPTPFFGLAMAKHLAPDRLVILGTPGSMWDALVEHAGPGDWEGDLHLALVNELIDAAVGARVDVALLERADVLMSRAAGRPCALRLVPYGRTPQEQADILLSIAEAIPGGRVSFDLTHGFRHLAALGLLSAFFLERVARFEIAGLYYGAFDMSDGVATPVMRLDGLLAIQRWIDALDSFDGSGDYGVFAPLLVADGVPHSKAGCLERAAFYERTSNTAMAREQLRAFLPVVDRGLPGTGRLFQKRLRERLDWARAATLGEHQVGLARLYLKRRDYLRAAIFAWEGLISRECEARGLDANEYGGGRKDAHEAIKKEGDLRGTSISYDDYRKLTDLRNALAHGTRPPGPEVQRIATDQDRLEAELTRLVGALSG
jgi:CRISPR-associated Csx2 family protein